MILSMLLLGVLAGIFGDAFDFRYFFAILLCLCLCLLFLENPEAGIIFFIVILPGINLIVAEWHGMSFGLNGILSLSLLPCWISYILLKKVRIKDALITFPFLALIGITCISFFSSVDKLQTARGIFRFFQIFLLYIIVLETFRDKAKINRLLIAVVASLIIPGMVGFWQYINDTGFHLDGYHRIYGTLTFPNHFSRYLIICLSAILALLFSNGRKTEKLFAGIMGVVCLVLLYLTFSRAAWAGAAAIFFIFALLHLRAGSVALALSPGLFLMLNPHIWERLKPLFLSITNPMDPSLVWRIFQWREIFRMFLSRPLLGHGWGTVKYYAFEAYGMMKGAHNEYLRFAFELGALGLMSFLGILYILFKETLWVYRNNNGDLYFKVLSSAYFALLLSLSALGLAGVMFDLQISFPLLIVLGAAVGSAKRVREKAKPS